MSILAALQGQIQEIRAQTLASLIAALTPSKPDGEGAQSAPGKDGGVAEKLAAQAATLTPGGEAAARIASQRAATLGAIIASPPREGRVTLIVAGSEIPALLPPALARLAAVDPALLRPGTPIDLIPDASPQGFRLSLPNAPNLSAQKPATILNLSPEAASQLRAAPIRSADAPPPLAANFPPGSLGATIARLAGPLPLGERQNLPLILDRPALPEAFRPASGAPASPFSGRALADLPPALALAVQRAIAAQVPLAPALSAILRNSEARLSAPVAVLRDLRLDGTSKPTPETLREAVARSGLFLEAGLAANPPGATPIADLKAALLALRAAFAGEAPGPQPARPNLEAPAPRAADALARPPARTEASTSAIATDLPKIVEGALERVKLLQFASLPSHPDIAVSDERAQGLRLALSLPLAVRGPDQPQTAAIGIVIQHQPQALPVTPFAEQGESTSPEEGFPWKVRLALDLEETGPIQAEIALRGQAIAVTLWAERRETAARARAGIGSLNDALREAAFEVTRLEIKDGRPMGQNPPPILALDRRS